MFIYFILCRYILIIVEINVFFLKRLQNRPLFCTPFPANVKALQFLLTRDNRYFYPILKFYPFRKSIKVRFSFSIN